MIEPKAHLKDIERTLLHSEPSRLGKVRLDRNDRNQPFSAPFLERIRSRLTSDLITAYPECWTAQAKVAEHIGVAEDCIQLHMGSEQAIKLVFETYIRPGDRILLHRPGYTMYPVDAQLFQAEVESQSCDAELRFDWEEYAGRIQPGLRMVVVENPNGFLGHPVDLDIMERIVSKAQECGALALVDEAYYLFHRETAVPLLEKHDNLVITRSFSKALGLAGLRAGCLISRPENIWSLSKFKPAYELTSVTAMILEELLDQPEEFERFAEETRQCLATFKYEMEALGFQTSPSVGNFLAVRLGSDLAEAWRAALAKRGVLIRRPFREEILKDWVRISTASLVTQLETIEILKALLASESFKTKRPV